LHISGFTRIDTVTVPDRFMSVITVSSDGPQADIDEIKAYLEKDRESLDYLAVSSDTDPLDFPALYKAIKEVRPRGLDVLLITDGRDPGVLDDTVGAGYAHAADIILGREVTDQQLTCLEILRDNRCRFALTVTASEHDEQSIASIAEKCGKCAMFIFRQDRKRPVDANMMSKLTTAAKKSSWNTKVI
jgi:hypothetical protein